MALTRRFSLGLTVAGSLLAAALAGCDMQTGPLWPQAGYESKVVSGMPSAVFQAALEETRRFCRVVRFDEQAGTIECSPEFVDAKTRTETGQLRIISTPSDLRRVTKVRITDEGGIRVGVSVVLERRDTAQIRAYQAMMRPEADAPTGTPVTAGAGLPPDRHEVWTVVGRDHAREADMLAAIENHLAPSSQPVEK